jgi:hypothetical protein
MNEDVLKFVIGLAESEEAMIKMDGYDDCILGVIKGAGQETKICYDVNLVIKRLMADGLSEDEALEFFEYNQMGAYVGESTPVFLFRGDI